MIMPLPAIIQGGMGTAVSDWRLASAVSRTGQLGVVSGTALDQVFVRRLQQGDPGGHLRRAAASFPFRNVAQRAIARYFIDGGRPANAPFMPLPMFRADAPEEHLALNVLANYCEVWLAKEGHGGQAGINLLDKIPFPNPSALYGAMLAGVDFVLMGAGIPFQVPGIIDALSRHDAVVLRVALEGNPADHAEARFDPRSIFGNGLADLRRPMFLGIVSSATAAQALLKRSTGRVDGFVIEHWTAGGHNAPPRGQLKLTESGEPIYGERDAVDFQKFRDFGLPFWLAGGACSPSMLAHAQSLGAEGVQVGTAFAFCAESGLDPGLRRAVLEHVRRGDAHVFTDPAASPTGFPFKVVELEGTLSESEAYAERERVCDLGFLRRAYRRPDGRVGYRCPGEPVDDFVKKGGDPEETADRKCLCNALMANIGLGQVRTDSGEAELPLLTAGDDLVSVKRFLPPDSLDYPASDVVAFLLSGSESYPMGSATG